MMKFTRATDENLINPMTQHCGDSPFLKISRGQPYCNNLFMTSVVSGVNTCGHTLPSPITLGENVYFEQFST